MQLDLDIRKTLCSGRRSFVLRVRLQSNSQRIVIVGPSGSGKSLTLKAIAGLLRPDAGHVRLDGQVLFDAAAGIHLPPQAREVAYVFQDYALFPHLTVRQNIAFSLAPGVKLPGANVSSACAAGASRAGSIATVRMRHRRPLPDAGLRRLVMIRVFLIALYLLVYYGWQKKPLQAPASSSGTADSIASSRPSCRFST